MKIAFGILAALIVSILSTPVRAATTLDPYVYRPGWVKPPPAVKPAKTDPGHVYRLTAYSCYDPACLTASGVKAGQGIVGSPLAGPATLAFGTEIEIEGMGRYVILDRCPGCDGDWLDVWQPNRAAEVEFGSQYRMVRILK